MSYSRTAMCGHGYASQHAGGRVKRFGDCGCLSASKEPKLLTCAKCATNFSSTRVREFCSHACAQVFAYRVRNGYPPADAVRECVRCGMDISQTRVHTKKCRSCAHATTPLFPVQVCPEPRCGVTFRPFKAGQVACGNSCAQKIWKSANRKPEPWDERRKANSMRRRALKTTDDAEVIVSARVFDRDGWVCGICALPIPSDLKWPHPDSATLDHIIPLSRGGKHVHENVQSAHAFCNISKNNRLMVI